MKHVFVETNFIIDVLRPFPKCGAERLLARHGKDVKLYVPWCCAAEATRTIERIIREDLAWVDGAGKFFGRLMNPPERSKPSPTFAQAVQDFIGQARTARREALFDHKKRVDELVSTLEVIPPSPAIVNRTLRIFYVKSLPPFDEMVLGAVLEHATILHEAGEAEIFFCNLNKNDFEPTTGNDLAAAYQAAGIQYLEPFIVP